MIARRASFFALLVFALAAVLAPASPALAAGCPNEGVRAEANSLALPDCRGYELASPAVKDFAVGANGLQTVVAAAQGGAVSFNTAGPMPGAAAGPLDNPNVARRGSGGWVNRPISPPQNPVGGQGQFPYTTGYSQDLSKFVFTTENPPLAPDVAENTINLYSGDTETGAYNLLAAESGGHQTVFSMLVGASDDFSRIFFDEREGLLPGAPLEGAQVYEWSGGQLKNVGILPEGTAAELTWLGQGAGWRLEHAVSDDGRRAIFTAQRTGNAIPGLYQRVDGTSTVYVSESKRTIPDPHGPGPARFWGASSDGGTVLFTSPEALTDDATTGEDGSGNLTDAGNDLYSYDVATDTLTDLTVDSAPADFETGANVQGVVGNSDDGQYAYFVARGDLATGATSGALNLYQAHGTAIEYIGALDPADSGAWELAQSVVGAGFGLSARVSASGDLAIQSAARLTSYDNAGTSQVYRYSTAGELTCVSCRPDGSPPAGSATIKPPQYGVNVTRNISADGSRVFFSSTDAILPADVNGKTDVYEWSGDQVHLISDGTGPFDSTFEDASANGDDVFFVTGARLVGQDTDSHTDVYDARVGGGFPAPPPIPPGCVGEACRTGTSAGPGTETAASASFQGPPNPTPKKPKKHKKKSKSRKAKTCKSKSSKKCKSQADKRPADKSGRGK